MFDNDYVIMALDSSRIAYFKVLGLEKTRDEEAYTNADILAQVENITSEVISLQGYSIGDHRADSGSANEYQYRFISVEKEGSMHYLKIYRLFPKASPPYIKKIGEIEIGVDKPGSISVKHNYIAVGLPQADSGVGQIRIYNSTSMELVSSLSGIAGEAEGLGKSIGLEYSVLTPY